MGDFLMTVAQNACVATVIAVGWTTFSTGVVLVIGRAIRYGME